MYGRPFLNVPQTAQAFPTPAGMILKTVPVMAAQRSQGRLICGAAWCCFMIPPGSGRRVQDSGRAAAASLYANKERKIPRSHKPGAAALSVLFSVCRFSFLPPL